MKMAWIDLRESDGMTSAIAEESIHQRIDGVVVGSAEDVPELPPTLKRVAFAQDYSSYDGPEPDVLIVPYGVFEGKEEVRREHPNVELGTFVEISDQVTLDTACEAAKSEKWTVVRFVDPTKIPLEIVLASANNAEGSLITIVQDLEEVEVVLGVLEKGSDGVMLAPSNLGEATKLKEACEAEGLSIKLEELEVKSIKHVGMGTRACVDTASQLDKDEGMLIGSRSSGMVLTCSETHPLPYMPTRPFRVNAGAIHSYVVTEDGECTNYLSELGAGSTVLAADHTGKARKVTVGRVKIEERPLLSIDATSESGISVNLIVQDDWHVRLLGPGASVLNVTELEPGDKLLGHVKFEERHVGLPIDEFCIEQ